MAAIRAEVPVTPVGLAAWSFQSLGAASATRQDLEGACLRRLDQARAHGLPATLSKGSPERAAAMGLGILLHRGVLAEEGGHLRVVPGREALLAYYAAGVAHHFQAAEASEKPKD